MKSECIQAVTQALGRAAKPSELAEIETRLSGEIRRMARKDRAAILSMTPMERMVMAAENAAKELVAEAELKAQRKVLAVTAQARLRNHIDTTPGKRLDRIKDILDFSSAGTGRISVASQSREIANMAFGNMLDTITATNPKVLGLFEDVEGTRALIKELHGEDSGNPAAKAGAKAFHDTAEQLRQRFNRAGGDIGKLERYDMPHHHSHAKIVAAGRDAWVKETMPLLDRNQYVKADGNLMDDVELREFLEQAYTTIATDGANKREAGTATGGTGERANRGNAHRQIHFNGSDAHIAYWSKFGEKSLFDVLQGHIRGISNDIAMVETLGPDADHGFKELLDYAVNADKIADNKNALGFGGQAQSIETLYRMVAGTNGGPANVAFANVARGLRSIQTGAKLGSAIISSVTDHAGMWLTSGFNNMKYRKVLQREMDLLRKPEMRETARRAGLGLDAMLSSLDRWGTEGLGDAIGLSGKFADKATKLTNAVMRASGLSQITDIRRQAFAIEMMDVLGSLSRKGWDDMDAADRTRLEKMGVSPKVFEVWRQAEVRDVSGRGDKVLTPQEIYKLDIDPRLKDEAATTLAALVGDEARMAVIEPSFKERQMLGAGLQTGTVAGELARFAAQFKSFGVSMVMRHLERGFSMPTNTGKAAYLVKHLVSTTLLGGMAVLLRDIINGKDPRDITTPEFAFAAFVQGGGLGIYGDFIYGGKARNDDSIAGLMLGPVGQLVTQPFQIASQAVTDAKEGKPVDVGGKVVQYIKGNTPGASLWYTRAAMDHLIWHDMMEFANPGYLRRMKQRTQRDTGQQYWWEPGENLPDRAPDFSAMTGE